MAPRRTRNSMNGGCLIYAALRLRCPMCAARMARARLRRLIGRRLPAIVPGINEADCIWPHPGGNQVMIDVTAADEIADDARARSNVARLAAAQALTGANSAVIFATGSIVGATLAPDISLATVPLSMYVVGLAAGTLPTGAISRAYGRRVAFIIGTGCGMLTGLLGAYAILRGSFVLFCCRDLSRRALRRGVAILSLRRRRRRQRRVSAEGGVVGDGRRRIRRRARSAARAVDHGYLAALSVRLQLPDAGRGRAGRDGGAGGRRCAEAGAGGYAWRPAAARDRAAAAVHRRRALRHRLLSHDEPGDDLGAAGDEDVRADASAIPISAFSGTSWRCTGRASLPAR